MAYRDPEKRREYYRKWRAANRERRLEYDRRYYEANKERRASTDALRNAQRKHEFTVSDEEFLAVYDAPCISCGYRAGTGVDRIDSDKGYVPGNLQSLCWFCNRAKQKAEQSEFKWWRAQMVRHFLFVNNLKAVPRD